MSQNNELWIEKDLIPLLVAERKLTTNRDKISNKLPTVKNVSVRSLTLGESFMLTLCYKVQVVLEDENGEVQTHYLVVKKTPSMPEDIYDATGFDNLFSNEITAYTITFPAIGADFNIVKYYYSGQKRVEAFIVLDDFSVNGFEMSTKRYDLSLEHILLAVKLLGQFHGQGYGHKLKNPEKFHNLVGMFKQARFNTEIPSTWNCILTKSQERFSDNIDSSDLSSIIPQEFLDKLKQLTTDYVKLALNVYKPVEPYATICHGDYLRNNIAFKYSEKDKDMPIEVMMFDFQTILYTNPMMDLCTLLALSAGSEVRADQFDLVFRTYWESLVANVCKKGEVDSENLPEFLSYESMIKEYIKYFALGIRIANFFLMELVDPLECGPESFVNDDEIAEQMFDPLRRGGEIVNRAVRSMILQLYKLTQKYDVDIFEHFEKLDKM